MPERATPKAGLRLEASWLPAAPRRCPHDRSLQVLQAVFGTSGPRRPSAKSPHFAKQRAQTTTEYRPRSRCRVFCSSCETSARGASHSAARRPRVGNPARSARRREAPRPLPAAVRRLGVRRTTRPAPWAGPRGIRARSVPAYIRKTWFHRPHPGLGYGIASGRLDTPRSHATSSGRLPTRPDHRRTGRKINNVDADFDKNL